MCTYQLTPTSSALPDEKPKQPLDNDAAVPPSLKRKTARTIRFLDEDDATSGSDSSRPLKRTRLTIEHPLPNVPLASEMTQEERSTLWMQQADHRATYDDVALVVKTCQASGNQQPNEDEECHNAKRRSSDCYVNFAEALATAYNICNEESPEDETSCHSNNSKELPLDQMIVFGGTHTQSRGLESRIIPGLGGHRYKKRREHIHGVLGVQRELVAMKTQCSRDELAEGLGAVSEYLSQPARRFARALGAVDGTMALLEYATVANLRPTETEETMDDTQAHSIGAFLSMQAESVVV